MEEAGGFEIFVVSFPDLAGKWQISNGGGRYPRWSPDGKRLFYLAPGNKLMVLEVSSAAPFKASPPHVLFTPPLVPFSTYQYDVGRDGRFLLNTRIGESSEPITLLTNWTGLVKH